MKQKLVIKFPVQYIWCLLISVFQEVVVNLRYFGSKCVLPVKKMNQVSGNGCFELNYTIFRSVHTAFKWAARIEVGA